MKAKRSKPRPSFMTPTMKRVIAAQLAVWEAADDDAAYIAAGRRNRAKRQLNEQESGCLRAFGQSVMRCGGWDNDY